ncbi:MAG: SLC13 family permease [Methyloligellaceae bacterium]
MTSIVQFLPEIAYLQMYVTFAVIVVAVFLFASERISLELSCASIVVCLLVFFFVFPVYGTDGKNTLDANTLLMGFANPVLFTILSLLVIGQGLFQTGAVDQPAQFLAGLSRNGKFFSFSVMLLAAGSISAFLNNTPVVVIFIPIATAIASKLEASPSQLLMPLSFITILGGMTTLIGSSSNLIVATIAADNGMQPFGFFDFLIPGAILAAIGALYVVFILPYILRTPPKEEQSQKKQSGKQFIAQIQITPTHPWHNLEAQAGMFPELKGPTVRLIQRGSQIILPPFEDVKMESGDVVIIAATRQILTEVLKKLQSTIPEFQTQSAARHEEDTNKNGKDNKRQLTMVEAVVGPGSNLVGQTIEQATLISDFGCAIFGIQRQSRMLRRPMRSINLEAGDVLLLLGTHGSIRSLRASRSLITLEWSALELPVTHLAKRALAIFLATILIAATGWLPIEITALAGAGAMLAFGCLNTRQAWRAIDLRIYLLIGTAFALAEPLQKTKGAAFIAETVVNTFSDLGPAALLSAFFLLTAILTNFLSNHATAALLTPVAVSAATKMGTSPEPFVYGLIFALNCSFATPIAYQTNLIVMGPGHYTFRDYLLAGLPLILLIWISYSILAPFYFGL